MNAPFVPPAALQRFRMKAKDFWLLADAGSFEKYAKTELIEGEVWVVNSVWVWHSRTVSYLNIELGIALRTLGSELIPYSSGSVDLTDDSVPEPDVAVGTDHEGKGLPLEKLLLAVEVSDATLAQDLGVKARLYGTAGVPEYWVIDREGSRVVQMWAPQQGGYDEQRDVPFGEQLTSKALPDVTIDTSGIRR